MTERAQWKELDSPGKILNPTSGIAAEVLNRKRGLSIDMIRKLSAGLRISSEVLIAEYALESDKKLGESAEPAKS